MDLSNIFRFPGAPEPTPQPEQPGIPDPFAALENVGRSLINLVGDMTVGQALEQLSRQSAKDILAMLFEGWSNQ